MSEESATTLLDATDTKTPDAANADTSLLDAGKAKDANQDGKPDAAAASPDGKTPIAADATPADKQAPVVPEVYADPKLPEGITLDPQLKTEFDAVAKDLKLSQEQYQKVVDIQAKHTESQIKQTMTVFNKQISDWAEETKKELGSDPAKSLAVASKAIDRIFTDPKENKEFREMMGTTGLGNWRLMVKAFSFVGKQISEDRFVEGRPDSKPQKSAAEVIFDHPTSVAAFKSGEQT